MFSGDAGAGADGPSAEEPQVVQVAGDLERSRIPELSERIDALIDGGQTRFVFNMRRVTFMDSSGVALLIRIHQRLHPLGGALAVSEPATFLAHMVESLGIEKAIPVFPSDADALEFLSGAA